MKEKLQEYWQDNEAFEFKDFMGVNHQPHPYMIGPKHIEHNRGMYLGEEQIKEMESRGVAHCAHPDCRKNYEEHTCDQVCFLALKKDLTQGEAQEALKGCVDHFGEKAFEGFAFIENEFKFVEG